VVLASTNTNNFTRPCANAQKSRSKDWSGHYEDLHGYALFMVNIWLRPDGSKRIKIWDVKIINHRDSGETLSKLTYAASAAPASAKACPDHD
jgi:hypothetical protein